MTDPQSNRISVSSWSLHRLLGPVHAYRPDGGDVVEPKEPYGPGSCSLLDLPRELKARALSRLEICSFHLPSLDAHYLAELRDALESSGIEFQSLLVEDGDLSHPETAQRDAEWIAGWIQIGEALGARHMRVIAGKQAPTTENLARSARHLGWIADQAEGSGVRVVTENWFALLPGPKETNGLLDALGGRVGLNGDFGNWPAPGRYEQLVEIMGRAELCHAKADYGADGLNTEDYRKCLEASRRAGYAGPFTMIYDSSHFQDEWAGIALQQAFVTDFLGEQ